MSDRFKANCEYLKGIDRTGLTRRQRARLNELQITAARMALTREQQVDGTKLPYQPLQQLRQIRIDEALLDPSTSHERLKQLADVAAKGRFLAYRFGADDSDAITFERLHDKLIRRMDSFPVESFDTIHTDVSPDLPESS